MENESEPRKQVSSFKSTFRETWKASLICHQCRERKVKKRFICFVVPGFLKKQHKFNNTLLCKSVFADLSRRLTISKENSSTMQRWFCCRKVYWWYCLTLQSFLVLCLCGKLVWCRGRLVCPWPCFSVGLSLTLCLHQPYWADGENNYDPISDVSGQRASAI